MSRSAVRVRSAVLAVAVNGVIAGCMIFSGKAHVTSIGDVPMPAGGIVLSVVFSPDFSSDTPRPLANEIVHCVTRGLAETAPEVRVLPADEFHRLVFGLKPGAVLLRPDTITSLLSRPDIRQRVKDSSVTHLVLVGGATRHEPGDSFFGGGAGYGAGFGGGAAAATRSTRLVASIVDLVGAAEVTSLHSSSAGSQGIGMVVIGLPFVWGWAHATESAACTALGTEVVRAIRGKTGAQPE